MRIINKMNNNNWHAEKWGDGHRIVFPNFHSGNRHVMLTSDIHYDSKEFDESLFKAHLKKAVELNAPILIGGDTFDAMQGRNDNRRSHGATRNELFGGAYFDKLVEYAVKLLEPAKHLIAGCNGKGCCDIL